MSHTILISSEYLSPTQLLEALRATNTEDITFEQQATTGQSRSVFADPVVIAAIVAGGVAIINKLIDAVVEIHKTRQDNQDKKAPSPIIQIHLRDDAPLRLDLAHFPEDPAERQAEIAALPELQEDVVEGVEVIAG
jgi:hypothetical protein